MDTNDKIFKAMMNEGSPALKSSLTELDKEGRLNSENVYKLISDFPTLKNEFLDSLVNRCVKTQFFTKTYNNRLKMLHNGMLGFGDSIQQVYTDMGKRKGFYEHFEKQGDFSSGASAENDLIGKRVPDISTAYITQNFEHKYKVTIAKQLIRKAFLSETGLSRMVADLINSNLNGAYRDEYRDMLGILTRPTAETTVTEGHKYEQGLIWQYAKDSTLCDTAIIPCGSDPKKYAEVVRTYAEKLTFDSDKYNLAKITTWSDTQDYIHITTPENNARIDVNVIASAFNVSATDIKIRTIIVDELPKNLTKADGTTSLGNVLGIVADKNIIQAWDIINETDDFKNANELTINYFLHKQGIMSSCKFCNMVVLTDKDPV